MKPRSPKRTTVLTAGYATKTPPIRSPKRTIVLTCHEAERLRLLLLHILDGKVEQQDMSEPMTTRIYDKFQDIHGISHYDPKERERQGFRNR